MEMERREIRLWKFSKYSTFFKKLKKDKECGDKNGIKKCYEKRNEMGDD